MAVLPGAKWLGAAATIRPLEKFIVPIELVGSHGLYRRPQAQCLLTASNDYQAILAWLRSKHGLTPQQKVQLRARRRGRSIPGGDGGAEPRVETGPACHRASRTPARTCQQFVWRSSAFHGPFAI